MLRAVGPQHIASVDPKMKRLIERVGPCALPRRRGRFASIVRAIVGQQVSTAAAQTIYGRLRAAAGGHVTPERVIALGVPALRAAGLSGQKVGYILELSAKVQDRTVRLERLPGWDDEAIVEHLTQVKGIGRWSAEMFLMFVLNRPDVLPVADLGIRNGFVRVYGLRTPPKPGRMEELAAPWRPFRTVGAWYLWRSLDLPDPKYW
jgi:DNA-3-methyladenine glycosylase II